MLGPSKVRALDRPVLVSLEALVPPGNFYRHLDAKLDLGFVHDWVRERYAANGRPSVDPVVFFKLQLILFFEGYRSERQLLAQASLNLAHRWYLGYHLDEPLPDHSSLTRIRDRLGRDIFRRFVEYVVQLCDQDGLIWGKELLADATRVQGNVDIDSLVPCIKAVVDGHLVDLFGGQAGEEAPTAPPDAAPPLHPATPTTAEEPEAAARDGTCRGRASSTPRAPSPKATSGPPIGRSAAPIPTPPPWPWRTDAPRSAIRPIT